MATRTILRYPDPRLTVAAAPVERFDADLRRLAADLLDTMRAAPGVGITAAHLGVPLRLVVLDLDPPRAAVTYVNPEITWVSPELITHVEGSVSMPGMTEEVTRPRAIRLRHHDLDGAVHEIEMRDFAAVCMQHEIDQLDGMFWVQRLSRLKRERLLKKWQKSGR